MAWLVDPLNASLVGALAFVISVLSLLVGVFGFWIAIGQIRATKRAAEVQSETIVLMQTKFLTVNLLAETSKADAALQEIKSHLLEYQSEAPYILFDNFARALSKIISSTDFLPNDIIAEVKGALETVEKLDGTPVLSSMTDASRAKQAKLLRDYTNLVSKVVFIIQERGL